MRRTLKLLSSALLLVVPAAVAQQPGVGDTPLDKLLNTPISAVAKYEQRLEEAAASVTIIGREEIERYGYETLADVLEAIRGLYLSDDRNYTYLGVRGFSRPGDLNNRVLLLIDGHPMTETVFGSVPLGSELVIDLASVERIEFVRGPGSVLYGTGAMLGVINVVTGRNAAGGASMAVGSNGNESAAMQASHGFASGATLDASGVWRNSRGQDRIYFKEFDSPATNNGIVERIDGFDAAGGMVSFVRGGLRLTAYKGSRVKDVPTAPWGADFGSASRSEDSRSFVEMNFGQKLSESATFAVRMSWDSSEHEFLIPAAMPLENTTHAEWASGEARLVWDPKPNHRLTAGAARVQGLHSGFGVEAGSFLSFHSDQHVHSTSLYVQHEYQPLSKVTLIGGIRYDMHSYLPTSSSPRLAMIIHPSKSRTFKLLAGDAYRAPSVFEMFLSDIDVTGKSNPALRPENVRTLEAVWEERLTPSLFAVASLYQFRATGLIERVDEAEFWQYRNTGTADTRGLEMQLDYRGSLAWAYASYSMQRSESDGEWLTNSPRHLIKAGATLPFLGRGNAAAEMLYDSGRKTMGGEVTESHLNTNLALSWRLIRRLRVRAALRNVFDDDYAVPVGVEHRQDSIARDGRTLLLKVTYEF